MVKFDGSSTIRLMAEVAHSNGPVLASEVNFNGCDDHDVMMNHGNHGILEFEPLINKDCQYIYIYIWSMIDGQ